MNEAKTNLRQRIGYFGTQNGVYFETSGAGTTTSALKAFVLRTYIGGTKTQQEHSCLIDAFAERFREIQDDR